MLLEVAKLGLFCGAFRRVFLSGIFVLFASGLARSADQTQSADLFRAADMEIAQSDLDLAAAGYKENVKELEKNVTVLKTQLVKARDDRLSDRRDVRVSFLAYRLFLAETRLLGERQRLSQVGALQRLRQEIVRGDRDKSMRRYLREVTSQHAVVIEAVEELADKYDPLLASKYYRRQFQMRLEHLREDIARSDN